MTPRPARECATCGNVAAGVGATLCLWSPPVVNGGAAWPAIARRIEENRDLRGVCGPSGHMWRIRHDA